MRFCGLAEWQSGAHGLFLAALNSWVLPPAYNGPSLEKAIHRVSTEVRFAGGIGDDFDGRAVQESHLICTGHYWRDRLPDTDPRFFLARRLQPPHRTVTILHLTTVPVRRLHPLGSTDTPSLQID